MAFVRSVSSFTGCCLCGNNLQEIKSNYKVSLPLIRSSNTLIGSETLRRRCFLAVGRWRLNATDVRVIENNNAQTRTGLVEIPVTCYQIVGVPNQAEKDEIVKSVMDLKNAEIEEGYTMDVVVSRQNLLMDVRDKLLFEPEYAGNVREKVPPKSSLRIPWAWLPGALCLLQEVGEEKLVLDIGKAALQHPDAKPHIHDLLLSMALAECAIAKAGFEKNNICRGFEALARAQCLLRGKISLGNMTLLSQIEESLEELAPACTLEILAMPHTPENAERRLGAIAALRELLRQGLDVVTSCQVQDWPCFLSQALNKLMASEIVDLLPWDNLAIARKNKKSIESQNQKVVIDFNCFYMALLAHFAFGYSSKQTDLINKAKTICECLIASEGIDLKFEEAFCLFLLGQGAEADAVEKLRQLELNSNPALQNSISGKEFRDVSGTDQSLEIWLKDVVLDLFPDTRDCSPSLVNFFAGEKKAFGNRQNKGASQTISNISRRPLSPSVASDRRAIEEPISYLNSSQHLGPAVKQLAPCNLQNPLTAGKTNNGANVSTPSVQLKRNLGGHHNRVWDNFLGSYNVVGKIAFVTVLGCVLFAVRLWRMGSASRWTSKKLRMNTSSVSWTMDSSLDQSVGPSYIKGISIAGILQKLLSGFKPQLRNCPDAANLQNPCLAASLSSSMTAVYKRPMAMEEAETLVKQWQATKAEALGPNHKVHNLFEVLDESMLLQWEALADAAKDRSCFWRFVLLQLCVLRAEILSDGIGLEMAEIEALLEEAAELVDDSLPKNPNYYSTYKIIYVLKRQDDGSWRFCKCDILPSS
ncbi:plastid division protein CDP1, chloroplastic [Cornus florida]|uniref:plastid division protein CDP1, chloroplastic n=1 Tax=Cornus florida TaxID=4283 RepID=UPI002898D4D6|nr:plastid division protein CDP1, chloroplastic [Cornus florida]